MSIDKFFFFLRFLKFILFKGNFVEYNKMCFCIGVLFGKGFGKGKNVKIINLYDNGNLIM